MQKRYRILLLLFVFSGFSGLIYESIWTHYLKLFLGHAAYAQTLVLAIFMGGMAIGSFLSSRLSGKWKSLLLLYALAEGMIGLAALLFHDVFDMSVRFSFTTVIPLLNGPVAINAYKWILSSILILPQTILLGMTFPLMSGAILREFPERPGRSVSMLYFTNSIGAALGVLISGFWLIGLVGLPGTIRLAGALNIAIALVVWYMTRGYAGKGRAALHEKSGILGSTGWYCAFLLVSLLTGTASFIYEIGWIRMLSLVLGSSTHAFELMLSSFIMGLAFGGLWIKGRIDRISLPVRYLVFVQIIMGLLALLTLPLYGNTFEVMQWLLKTIGKTDGGYALFNLSSHVIASAIMLPATFFAGMTLPLITYTLFTQGHGERSIGAVYGANTVGAIIGVFFATHLGLPLLGLKNLLVFGASLDIVLGLALLWSPAARYGNKKITAAITAFCIAALGSVFFFAELDPYKMASGVYREVGMITRDDSRLMYHKDGKTATVSVALQNGGVMQIRTNGKTDASVNMAENVIGHGDEATAILAAALPLSLNPQARTAANIGLGSGMTTNTLLSFPRLEQVDTIEIEQGMVEAARNFGRFVDRVYMDPRSRIYIEDAKTFFSAHNRKYDIIISEPSNPWVSGVAGLFSSEFYELINRHLSDNGLFVQWVQLYEIDLPLVVSVLKAVSSHFSDFVVYAPIYGDILIIAANHSLSEPDPVIFKHAEVRELLGRVSIEGMQDINVRMIGNKKILGSFIGTFPIEANSDYYPVLDQNAARARFLKSYALDMISLVHEPLPAIEMLLDKTLFVGDTRVTPTPLFPKTQIVYSATLFRDYLLQGDKPGAIPDDIRLAAYKFRSIFFDCSGLPEDVKIRAIFNGAINFVPYLSSDELDRIWQVLDAGPCARETTQAGKNWIAFFKALGRRDAAAVAGLAEIMLESGQAADQAETRYLIATQMVGSLAQGKKEKAAQIWLRYQPQIPVNSMSGILFRLLAANSASR